jgi:hypothetical protein
MYAPFGVWSEGKGRWTAATTSIGTSTTTARIAIGLHAASLFDIIELTHHSPGRAAF